MGLFTVAVMRNIVDKATPVVAFALALTIGFIDTTRFKLFCVGST